MSQELQYVILIFALFVVPKFLQRYRLPGAITSMVLGFVSSLLGWFQADATIPLLATYGITSLFLLAGLEVDFEELRRGARVLAQHVAIRLGLLAGGAVVLDALLGIGPRAAWLLSLALFTPSTGFILDSIPLFGLKAAEGSWIRSLALAAELMALGVLFVTLQSTSAAQLGIATLALAGLVAVIPLLLEGFAKIIAPFAPKSEVAFLLMLGVVCAFATKKLGVYYLVGAFLVGIAARRFRERLQADSSERILHAVEAFAAVFAPFYFFKAGLELTTAYFTRAALVSGGVFLVLVLPIRLGTVILHRKLALGEAAVHGLRIGLSLMPTLVFCLVIAGILRDQFALPPHLVGGLVIYAVVSTAVPGFLLRSPTVR